MVKIFFRPFVLVILDGWGISQNIKGNAVRLAKIPFFNKLWLSHPHTELKAAGLAVGLPKGQIGNSEAGHMNIGAGRLIMQEATFVNDSINDRTFFQNPAFIQATRWVKRQKSHLHLMGLLTSVESAHADRRHLYALLDLLKKEGLRDVYLHLFTDGRDALPTSGVSFLRELLQKTKKMNFGRVVSLAGRYYAMDRIQRWNRIEMVYDNLTLGNGEQARDSVQALKNYYSQGITDEFIPPTLVTEPSPVLIGENDGVIFFNLRSDRGKEMTQAFSRRDFTGFSRKKILNNLCFVTMTEFGPGLERVLTAYPAKLYGGTLPKVLGQYHHQYRQLYIAESEKFPHVTYFFNGGFARPVDLEHRIRIPSPQVKSYAEKPEMKAAQITQKIISYLEKDIYNFIVVNYANPDMVGHTGNLKAAIQALEFLDQQLLTLCTAIKRKKGIVILTADHGNVEEMIDLETGGILTAHTKNPVPFILVDWEKGASRLRLRKEGVLSNIAPTILDYLGLERPAEMNEESLIIHNNHQ